MTEIKSPTSFLEILPDGFLEKLFVILCVEYLIVVHTTSKVLFERCHEFIRHGREHSRLNRKRYLKQVALSETNQESNGQILYDEYTDIEMLRGEYRSTISTPFIS